MSMFHKLASVLEAAADVIENAPVAPTEQKVAAAPAPAQKTIAELYEAAVGSELDADLAQKIASDETLRREFEKLAYRAAKPEALGSPADIDQPEIPRTRYERAKAAEDQLLRWIVS